MSVSWSSEQGSCLRLQSLLRRGYQRTKGLRSRPAHAPDTSYQPAPEPAGIRSPMRPERRLTRQPLVCVNSSSNTQHRLSPDASKELVRHHLTLKPIRLRRLPQVRESVSARPMRRGSCRAHRSTSETETGSFLQCLQPKSPRFFGHRYACGRKPGIPF